jgi:hypothetical protein
MSLSLKIETDVPSDHATQFAQGGVLLLPVTEDALNTLKTNLGVIEKQLLLNRKAVRTFSQITEADGPDLAQLHETLRQMTEPAEASAYLMQKVREIFEHCMAIESKDIWRKAQ